MVAASPVEREVWRLLADVPDPEIPILNVIELGVVRYVRDDHERGIAVGVSPTYTGCPATEVIQASIKARLQQAGFESVRVDSVRARSCVSTASRRRRNRSIARAGCGASRLCDARAARRNTPSA
jgi:metal-sulfur cluster biosynthetic enzyme